ncbi:PREDICTED: LOB domain-containing protein 9-like [Camelina sativa]|uniref:LOB domain-containing protein 9-like n=1 Tax=Camelina sativa TaxID=90675 RepID=A0ABM0W6M2_CAMSA|nr:PREDICTED: LOB domain-containing protein 9-like [Camelina sativa]
MDVQVINVTRAPCALCTTKNKVCPQNCEFAPYFPGEKKNEYKNAHKLFGTPNIMKMIRSASTEKEKGMLASSILMEGTAWETDPVKGGFGIIQKLKWNILLRKLYLNELKEKIKGVEEETKLHL